MTLMEGGAICPQGHAHAAAWRYRGVMIAGVIAYSRSKAVVKAFWSILLANPTHLHNMLVGLCWRLSVC
jgi:hypothetical protein